MNKFFRALSDVLVGGIAGIAVGALVIAVIVYLLRLAADGHEWLYIILAPLMLPLLIVVMRTKDKGG